MMKALVTGASGFVGGYLVARLAAAGTEVLGIDAEVTAPSGRQDSFDIDGTMLPPVFPEKEAKLQRCDLLEVSAVEEIVSGWHPDVVFHLAAQSSAARSFEDPEGTLRVNVLGTLNLLEAVRKICKARILVTGSCEEYGRREPGEMPLREDAPIEPVSPYGSSKAAQNLLSMQYHRAFGMEIVATRSFSHTGPGQAARFALPAFAKQCVEIKAGLKEPVLRTGSLDVTRDFLDVRDVVEAYLLLAEKGRPGTTYNVCSGSGLTLSGAVEYLAGMTGHEVAVQTDPDLLRPVDVPVLTGDNSRIISECGWAAVIKREKMLEDLFSWWETSIKKAKNIE